MNWNYRIIQHPSEDEYEPDSYYMLHEVHYHGDGAPHSYSHGGKVFVGSSPYEVSRELRKALRDLRRHPILRLADFER